MHRFTVETIVVALLSVTSFNTLPQPAFPATVVRETARTWFSHLDQRDLYFSYAYPTYIVRHKYGRNVYR